MRAAQFWLREIWGPQWDGERRALLLRHYWSYVTNAPIPPVHVPPVDEASAAEQCAFSERYWQRIDSVQSHAAQTATVRLTYRPIGKNLRHVATAIRRNTDRGVATVIGPEGPRREVRALAARGHHWDPWLWSRTASTNGSTATADAAWRVLFERPSRDNAVPGKVLDEPNPAPRRGCGAFDAAQLQRVLKLAVATDFAFSPRRELRDEAAALQRSIGWPDRATPVLGLHVRRSDAASSESDGPRRSNRASFAMSRYLEDVDRLCAARGIRHVFLATESADEIERAASLRPRLTFLTLNHDRALFPSIADSPQFIEELALKIPGRAQALARMAILDLLMLRDCAAFVGTFNSEFSVLSWLLCTGARRQAVPYVSLSTPAAGLQLHPYDALLNVRNNCPLELYHW